MPLFAAFFGAAIVSFAEWLVKFFSKRVAMAIAVFGVLFSSFLTVLVAVRTALGLIYFAMPEGLARVFLFVWPSNLGTCVAAYVSVMGIMAGWQWHRENLKLAAHYIT